LPIGCRSGFTKLRPLVELERSRPVLNTKGVALAGMLKFQMRVSLSEKSFYRMKFMHDIDTMYLTKKDLVKSLNVSLSTIDRRLKELPHYKWGNKPQSRVVFVAREVRDYFDSNYSVNKKRESQ
jgi:hypothetical protein